MGVYTKFDELKDKAVENIEEANKNLKEALDKDTWGYSDYDKGYLMQLLEIQHQLEIILITKLRQP